MKYDKEERDILDALEKGRMKLARPSKKERHISFEQIIIHLSRGDVWKVTDHPDQSNYPGQKLYFVVVDSYIYIVPYVV